MLQDTLKQLHESHQGTVHTVLPVCGAMEISAQDVVLSPHYPQSNSKAQATVKSMKKITRTTWNGRYVDGDKLCRALIAV